MGHYDIDIRCKLCGRYITTVHPDQEDKVKRVCDYCESTKISCPQCERKVHAAGGLTGEVCDDCHKQNEIDHKLIFRLERKGHTRHCAKRQVWGDGECECAMRSENFQNQDIQKR